MGQAHQFHMVAAGGCRFWLGFAQVPSGLKRYGCSSTGPPVAPLPTIPSWPPARGQRLELRLHKVGVNPAYIGL